MINFAQGEMAMFTTYIAWALMAHHGLSYWPAFGLTLVLAFFFGAGSSPSSSSRSRARAC